MRGRPLAEYGRWARILATGLSFATFGIGALLLSFTWFPLLRLRHWRDDEAARRAIQRTLSAAMRRFVGLMTALGLIGWETEGLEHLDTAGALVIANHPTLIDVVFLIGFMPEVDCIVKAALFRNPFLRWPVAWAGYIPNDDAAPGALVAQCAQSLAAGRSLIIFPEGTRSVPGRPLAMRRGAAQIALAGRCPIVPVTITCEPLTLTKHSPWWQVPPRRARLRFVVEPAYAPADVIPAGLSGPLAARRLTRHFAEYYTVRLGTPPLPAQ